MVTVHEQYLSILPVSKRSSSFHVNSYNDNFLQTNSNYDIHLILLEIKSTTLSHSYPSCSMNNSSSSSTYTSSSSPCLSSFPLSKQVGSSFNSLSVSDPLFVRIHHHIYRTPCLCFMRYNGKGSLRRL
jgi:hypothetical protein